MIDIKIHKKNEIYLFLELADRGIGFELQDIFSYYVAGYKHMPKYKAGIWDGKIKLFNIKTNLFPYGLIVDLIRFCTKYGYTYELVGEFKLINLKQDLIDFKDRIKSITKMSIVDEYQFQFDAIEQLVKFNKALLKSPTASGKSNIIYMLLRFFLEVEEGDILICVPAVSLVDQLYHDFIDYTNDDFNTEEICHRIYAGRDKNVNKRVTITTWQSIYNLPAGWFTRFGVFICDEAHQADGTSLTKIINNMPDVKYRFGLTGTLDGTKIHELQMRSLFGPIIDPTSSKKLMDAGVLANLVIECDVLVYSKDEIAHVKKYCKTYQDEIEWLVNNDRRNKFIIAKAFNQTNNTLVLFNFIEGHGQKLFDVAKLQAEKYGKQVFFIHGGVKVEEREEIRRIAEQSSNIIIFASYGTFSQGVNVRNLHSVIFAHPFKSKIRNLQSIGRILRKHDSKTEAKLIDIGDDLSIGHRQNIAYLHFIERLKIYNDEQFDYKIQRFTI